MRSVADTLRGELFQRVLEMTPAERVALTGRLAAEDIRLFAAARRIPAREARRLLMLQRRNGRRPSPAIDALFVS